ncbi:FUSC family protein [Burkholderia gladioli]|uniref:FUSC family protein n=1 Tax=Burkholderia gladioli TaxID=28095 RepID=UPI001640E33F|nr:FUSC family protein [Burkholderia gladioli]MDN7918472.1 FUSC family protein [Burkholderia gladioli]
MIAAACSRALTRARLQDPDFTRLRAASRSTLACLLSAGLGVGWALHHQMMPTVAVPGALFAMIAPLFLREPRWSGWLVSLITLWLCAGACLAAAAALAPYPALRIAGSLAVVFVGLLCQTLGARAVGAGLLGLVSFYLGLYLHPSGTLLVEMLGIMTLAAAIVTLVGRILVPVAPGGPADAIQPLGHGNEAGGSGWRRALHRLAELVVSGRLTGKPLGPSLAHRLHRLAWRPALVATAAALLAMLAGGSLSADRSMWAVISTFVVFLGTTSRQGTRVRVFKRIAGTLAGAAASVLCVNWCGHQPWLLIAAMALSVFGWAYHILHAYTRGVFFITTLVGLVYGQLGFAILPLARLRIEEVLAGCLVSLALALWLMPSAVGQAPAVPQRH